MNRITVDVAIEAFEKSSIMPEIGTYGSINKQGKACGCVFTALYCAEKKLDPMKFFRSKNFGDIRYFIEGAFSSIYSRVYIAAFMKGFDHTAEQIEKLKEEIATIPYKEDARQRINAGFEDGNKVRTFFINAMVMDGGI